MAGTGPRTRVPVSALRPRMPLRLDAGAARFLYLPVTGPCCDCRSRSHKCKWDFSIELG